jgi:hypothetical protein
MRYHVAVNTLWQVMIKVEWKDKFLFCAIIYSVGELIL